MSTTTATILLVHLAATAAMMGLIWFVQVVHYPLFDAVGADDFVAYEAAHIQRTSWVVGPFMAAEGLTALWIAAMLRDEVGTVMPLAGLALLAVVHASTVALQVPAHGLLSTGYDADQVARLVSTNWIRTVGWTARAVLAGVMVVAAIRTV
ncbi:MAG: hypothetical protein AAF467_18285 [Actinomycetota bacterium]